MCALCGTLGDGHWSDGLAGPPAAVASAVPSLRRQARRRRIDLGNRVLTHYGLSVADWGGTSFVLRNRTGATDLAATLADLWPKADRLAGRPLDPLDPALLRRLDGDRG